MDPAELAVNFGSAILGAIAGYLGAVRLHNGDQTRRERGAIRAVYYEVRLNAARMKAAIEGPMLPVPLSRTAYDSSLPALAVVLEADELEDVSWAYIQHENIERILEEAIRTATMSPESVVLLEQMIRQQVPARDALVRRGFTPGEQAQIANAAKARAGQEAP